MALDVIDGDDDRVPATFAANVVTVTVPRTGAFAPPVHVGAIVGNAFGPTDVAPNTGFVASGSCCGDGIVDAGEDCDGGGCCTSTCTFDAGASCIDGDPCFDDACDPTSGCVHTDRIGFPGVVCAFERALPTLCNGQTVGVAKLDKAEMQIAEAATASPGKRAKLIKKARKCLNAQRKAVDKAQRKDRVTVECADGVRAQLDDIAVRLDRALAGG